MRKCLWPRKESRFLSRNPLPCELCSALCSILPIIAKFRFRWALRFVPLFFEDQNACIKLPSHMVSHGLQIFKWKCLKCPVPHGSQPIYRKQDTYENHFNRKGRIHGLKIAPYSWRTVTELFASLHQLRRCGH